MQRWKKIALALLSISGACTPVQVEPEADAGDTAPLPGFAEPAADFDGPRGMGLTAIDGGLKGGQSPRPTKGGERPRLRVVKTDE